MEPSTITKRRALEATGGDWEWGKSFNGFFKNIFEVRSGWNMESGCELNHFLVEIG